MGWTGLRSAMVGAAIVAAGCAGGQRVDAQLMADRGFNIGVDSNGCPVKPMPFGPPNSQCPPGNPADCVQVPAGASVRFTTGSKTDFALEFPSANGSPFEDGTLKALSRNGSLEKKTESPAPAPPKNVFPFRVLGVPGSGCPNVDPQIILN